MAAAWVSASPEVRLVGHEHRDPVEHGCQACFELRCPAVLGEPGRQAVHRRETHADAPERSGALRAPCRSGKAATRPPDAAEPPDHRRARSRSAPRQRPTAHRGPAHTCTATSSGPPAATTPPASTPPRCPAHPPAPAWPRRSGPATDHDPGGYDGRPRPAYVSPEPHLKADCCDGSGPPSSAPSADGTARYDHLRSPSPIAGIVASPVLARPDAVGVLRYPSFAFTARLIDASIGTVGDAL